jgi:hypothetical protein
VVVDEEQVHRQRLGDSVPMRRILCPVHESA